MKSADSERDSNDEDLLNDINEFFCSNELTFQDDLNELDFQDDIIEFSIPLASGFRFRYQSEIDKKSFSAIKGEKNQSPSIRIKSSYESTIRIDLVTENSTVEEGFPHFYTLYNVAKAPDSSLIFENGICFIKLNENCLKTIKLDFLGIRKWKLKEAIPRIQELFPKFNETKAKEFFNKNKETLKLRASLFRTEYMTACAISHTIKSQITKENKYIKIQHISPKNVVENGETLIIVLEKKITSDSVTWLIHGDERRELKSTYEDGQTFTFPLPPMGDFRNVITAKIKIECSDSSDEKPIRFIPHIMNEIRKRKPEYHESINCIPLKKPTNYDTPQQLYPESGNADSTVELDGNHIMDIEQIVEEISSTNNNIEYDGPESMYVDGPSIISNEEIVGNISHGNISENGSCKDSGVYCIKQSPTSTDSEDERSFHESDDESDDIEVEGNGRRRTNEVANLEPLNFPPTKRPIDSHLDTDRKDKVANKIFSEVARIGHDFAFGKEPADLFARMEKQLPVVFTLQDDVGDTPLNNAILKGNIKQAERILQIVYDECKWALDLVNTSGHTALILAPACDVPSSFITKLLNAGCRLDKYDDLGKSAITYAIEYQNTKALEVLLQYVKDNNMNSMLKRMETVYFSPLQVAVMNNYRDGVKMLLSLKNNFGNYMVDVNELDLSNGETALTMAVERSVELSIIQLLLERRDININYQKKNGATVLHKATKMKMHQVMELLKRYSAVDKYDGIESDEESADDMEEDGTASVESCAIVEMVPENGGTSNNLGNLSDKMATMSIKGTDKKQLINILINGEVVLSVEELGKIIRPNYKSLLPKSNGISASEKEISDMLERFNCLPNSLGQLFEKLKEINRLDIIDKVLENFSFSV